MSHFTKRLAVVVAISLGAFVSQVISGDNADPADSTHPGANAQPRQKAQSRARRPAADVPLQHAILTKEDEPAEERILSALDKTTDVEFSDLPLEDALMHLQEHHHINIWLDRQTLTDEGVALDQPVTLKLAGVRIESALNLLLSPLQLDWVIQDEVLRITTRAWTFEHPEIQSYDVANLIEAGHTPEELIAAITKCVEPGAWTGDNATAGIAHTGGVLVVRQTQRAHGEVARLIADLEEIAASDDVDPHGKGKSAVVSVKVYRTGDQPAEKIGEALQDFVCYTSWTNQGGEGEVRALQGALIVKQTALVHHSIQRFLAQFEPKSPPDHEQLEPLPIQAAHAQTSPDPFGVLVPAGRQSGSGHNARGTDRPKSPIKK